MKIKQIFVDGFDNNYSYLVIGKNNEGVLIDPTGDKKKIEEEIKKSGVKIKCVLATHSHSDHIEYFDFFSMNTNSFTPKKEILGEKKVLNYAGLKIIVIHTPGHTDDSVVYLIKNNLFSGDTLFCKGVGTTSYGGNKTKLKKTLNFFLTLNPNLVLWPGHNYGGNHCLLGIALANSNISPSKETLKKIREKVSEYESKNKNKTNF